MKFNRRNLPLNAMRAFEAAARHCHMRRAAEELGVTHGALSRQVKQLEELLGTALFDRSHNRLALTHAGQRLQHSVEQALDLLTTGALYLDPDSIHGDLTIAATPSVSSAWLLPIVGDFAQQYPEINVQLINIAPRTKQIDSQIDVAVCFGPPDPGKRRIEPLFREHYFPVCNPKLLKPGHRIRGPQDLLQYPLLCDRHNNWPRWFKGAGMEETPTYRQLTLEESFLVLAAVKAGYGIALVDRIEMHKELHNGQLVALHEATLPAGEEYFLLTDAGPLSLRAQLFVEYLHAQLERMGVTR
ncbi:LysR family transcriptional regulator [Pseudomaricurvus alkylphenolicus]|uniref:LysR substrate-binding domain-containing protein n=1 Tax=Pseudomaricurvus alkylphenolicus TaxID=1306991 RepID=UPI0014225B31|nr:LysR substrate-binding domain-containing protein [Pseudomaricurvus alkylphenolicus]NIB39881.1 LysR family transcriptional regulator [Pseudomaricurvus alkylphenolicus]